MVGSNAWPSVDVAQQAGAGASPVRQRVTAAAAASWRAPSAPPSQLPTPRWCADTLEQRILDALVAAHPKALTGAQLAKMCGHFKLKSKVCGRGAGAPRPLQERQERQKRRAAGQGRPA
jgi:hypothetical protein